jgi:hypothetical protein
MLNAKKMFLRDPDALIFRVLPVPRAKPIQIFCACFDLQISTEALPQAKSVDSYLVRNINQKNISIAALFWPSVKRHQKHRKNIELNEVEVCCEVCCHVAVYDLYGDYHSW